MDNKIIVDTKLVLSKQQLYIISLFSGMEDRKESDFLFNNPEKTSEIFSKFCSEDGFLGSTINDIFNLGLLSYLKYSNSSESLKDDDVYYDYLKEKKYVVKDINIDTEYLKSKYIDKNYEPTKEYNK